MNPRFEVRHTTRSAAPGSRGAVIDAMPPRGRMFVYAFFGVHMLMFGLAGFLLAYARVPVELDALYIHGGIAIVVYLVFYLSIFGRDAVGWMLVNAALGILGIQSQIGWILARFGRNIDDYTWQVNVVPFTYYVLYTFLLRQFLLDLTRSRDKPRRRAWVEAAYVAGSVLVYGGSLFAAA